MAKSMAGSVGLTHLGAAGWEISDGRTVILTDPYLSLHDELVPDNAAIDARISRAG